MSAEATGELTAPELDPDYQLTLEQCLLPSPNSIELDRNPDQDFIDRLRMNRMQVGELYMENSKLTRSSRLNAVLDEERFVATRDWYIATAYRMKPEEVDEQAATQVGVRVAIEGLPPPLSGFLTGLVNDERTAQLLYAIDLFLLVGGRSYRLSPRNDFLWLDRLLQPEEGDALTRAIQGAPLDKLKEARALLAFVAVPVRYSLFQGPRGYRRTLVDLGALLDRATVAAASAGIDLVTTLDMFDHEIDRLLLLDGIERSVHAIGLLVPASEGTSDDRDS